MSGWVGQVAWGLVISLIGVGRASLPAQSPRDSSTRQPLLAIERELFQVGGASHSLQFSPDGALLASGGDRGDVTIQEVATGKLRQTLAASDHWIGALRFSPDGARLAVAGRTVTVWDVASGRQLGATGSRSPRSLDWSADGKLLAVVQGNGSAALLSAEDLTEVQGFDLPGPTAVDAIAIDGTATRLAVGKRSGETFVFDVASGKHLRTIAQPDWVHDLRWLDDGRLLRLGWKGALRGYDEEELAFAGYGYSMVADGTGARVFVRSSEAILEYRDGKLAQRHDASGPIALHPNGTTWANASAGRIHIRDANPATRSFASVHRESPGDAVLTGDGRYAVCVGVAWSAGTTQVFEVATGRRLAVDGFPTAGKLVANSQGTEVVVHAQAAGGDTAARELQFWAILPPGEGKGAATGTAPHVARLVRKVAFRMEVRDANPGVAPGHLSSDLRYFSAGDQVVDLLDDARSHRPNRILVSESHPIGERYVAARISMHSHVVGQPGLGQIMMFARDQESGATSLHKQIRIDGAPSCLVATPDGKHVAVSLGNSVDILSVPDLALVRTVSLPARDIVWVGSHHALLSGTGDELLLADMRTGDVLQTLHLGSWARRIDYQHARGVALVAVQDRALIVRVALPAR